METTTDGQTNTKGFKNRKAIIDKSAVVILLLVTIIVAGSGKYFYQRGFDKGTEQGKKDAVSNVTDILNPLNAISNSSVFPYTVIGKVTNASSTELTIKQPNGDIKKVALNDKTKVSQGTKVLSITDIKEDSSITAFTTGKDKDQVATRVVLR
jgi:Na+-transporting NADH:ubiquinone oxidoreductase subunit NqrC